MSFQAIKRYGHDVGLSACFRQWRARSHCSQLHGYALAFELTFEADELNEHGWVIDFGALKGVKELLAGQFDHTTLVAADDPHLIWFEKLARLGAIDLRLVENVGCEAFAAATFLMVERWLKTAGHSPRVRLVSVLVSEHGANAARAFGSDHVVAR